MSDRLKDLQRQRSLAQEQLAWLDREIAREAAGTSPTPPAPAPVNAAPGAPQLPTPSTTGADEIIAQYQEPGRSVHSEVKRGCYVYFFGAFAVLFLALAAYWVLRRH